MKIINTVREMQEWSLAAKRNGKKIAVVPTMGFLHEGHLSLIDTARNAGADLVVTTIFVNPIQFGPNEDFEKYPRNFEHDSKLCEEKGVDAVFAPSVKDMYPEPITCMVVENALSKGLCAKTRPTHFAGVATVVAKLFNAVLPDIAVFGQKDGQQARVLKRMVRDLNFPIKLIVSPLVREKDGLALSSRNKYLSADERARALSISKSLFEAEKRVANGEKDIQGIIDSVKKNISDAGGRVDYVEMVDEATLEPVSRPVAGAASMLAVAAYFGATRLIDNVILNWK